MQLLQQIGSEASTSYQKFNTFYQSYLKFKKPELQQALEIKKRQRDATNIFNQTKSAFQLFR